MTDRAHVVLERPPRRIVDQHSEPDPEWVEQGECASGTAADDRISQQAWLLVGVGPYEWKGHAGWEGVLAPSPRGAGPVSRVADRAYVDLCSDAVREPSALVRSLVEVPRLSEEARRPRAESLFD